LGLITKEVEVVLAHKNIKYFESLRYEIPRRKDKYGKISIPKGTVITVKVEDLQKGSCVRVNAECDCCGKEFKNLKWNSYLKGIIENNKYYCNKCIKILHDIENCNNNIKSFKQWCIDNNRRDVLDRWDYELNNKKPDEIGFGNTNKKYYFKCPRNLHKSELKNIGSFTYGHEGSMNCNQCNSFAQKNIDNIGEDFLDKYWDYEKNNELGINPWEIPYQKNIKVWIKCQEKDYHGSTDILCSEFIGGCRCSYCGNFKTHKLDSLGTLHSEVFGIWSDKNKKSPYEYSPKSTQYAYWKCPEGKHEDYYRRIKNSNNAKFKCPECSRERTESIIQEKVRTYLELLTYTILHEYNCNIIAQNPKIKNKWGQMPYDNEIKELKLIIEVHGKQHYEIVPWHKSLAKQHNTSPEKIFHYQKVKDRYKRMFAKSKTNKYHYLEIPYYTDDKKETWKKLIDDKIDYIIKMKYIEEQNKIA